MSAQLAPGQWTSITQNGGEEHVYPSDDIKEHLFDERCWCKPLEKIDSYAENKLGWRYVYYHNRELNRREPC